MAIDFERDQSERLYCGDCNQIDNLQNVSVSFWLKAETILTNSFIAAYKLNGWRLGFNGSKMTYIQFYSGDDLGCGGSTTLAVATLYHFLYTYNRGGGTSARPKMYINGVAETVSTSSAPTGTVADDSAGAGFYVSTLDATAGIDGLLEDFRVFNKIVSPQEALVLYNGGKGFPGAIGGEVLWIRCIEANGVTQAAFEAGESLDTGETIPDESGYGSVGVPQNTPHGSTRLLTWTMGTNVCWF
jgi:hypothetical protein